MKFQQCLEKNGSCLLGRGGSCDTFQQHLGKLVAGLLGNTLTQESVAIKESQKPISLLVKRTHNDGPILIGSDTTLEKFDALAGQEGKIRIDQQNLRQRLSGWAVKAKRMP
jgi:hypothetical protein